MILTKLPRSSQRKRRSETCDESERNTKRKKVPTRTWEDSFEALKQFKEEHGDCNVPTKFQKDRALGVWVEKVRRGCPPLSQQQRDRLTRLGFNWETLDQRNQREWNEKYARLKEYKNIFGNCLVPTSAMRDRRKQAWAEELGQWVGRQRALYRKGRLDDWKKEKLDMIEFDPTYIRMTHKVPDTTLHDRKWKQHYQQLLAFQQQHGHCLITLTTFEDNALFTWVKMQREVASRNEMRKDRKELLDEIGFVWKFDDTDAAKSHNQRQWNEMFCLLVDYKKKHGHVSVPRKLLPLGNWLDHQRVHMRKKRLNEDRLASLLSIGVQVDER